MKKQTGTEWTIKHLKRQARLAWLITHHLISESYAEKLDQADNDNRKKQKEK